MKSSWYSPQQEQTIKNWQKLQFGMFIHFGLYSLAGGCWNGIPVKKGYCEQILAHGNLPPADYEALMQQFEQPAITVLAPPVPAILSERCPQRVKKRGLLSVFIFLLLTGIVHGRRL